MKEFFSTVVGGQNDGLTFKKWVSSPMRWFPTLFISGFCILLWSYKPTFTEPLSFWLAFGFISSVLCIWVYKTLQHWNDLKNSRSR